MKIGAKVSQPCQVEIQFCIGLSDSEIRATPLRKKIQYFLFAIAQKNWNFQQGVALFSCKSSLITNKFQSVQVRFLNNRTKFDFKLNRLADLFSFFVKIRHFFKWVSSGYDKFFIVSQLYNTSVFVCKFQICNQQVVGSIPITSSNIIKAKLKFEWQFND